MEKNNVNGSVSKLEQQDREKEAIAFLESIGYQVFPEEKRLVHSQESKERYPLNFLKKNFL